MKQLCKDYGYMLKYKVNLALAKIKTGFKKTFNKSFTEKEHIIRKHFVVK